MGCVQSTEARKDGSEVSDLNYTNSVKSTSRADSVQQPQDNPTSAQPPVSHQQLPLQGHHHKPKSRQNSLTKGAVDDNKKEASSTVEASSVGAIPGVITSSAAVSAAASIGPSPSPRVGMVPKSLEAEQIAAGWPAWLATSAGEAIRGWVPRRAESFEKLDKIGQGTYSNVYKARDLESNKLVALKKVRFDNLEPESVKFMAREIEVLRRLQHPNIVQLLGLVTSRMSCSLYLVFEYMEHDLAGLAACPGVTFTEPQVKCYMKQLLSGLEHCHTRGVLHRDIKGSNLLLDNHGQLKIADFGLATFYRPEQNVALTSRVVTLWYRPPELLLGATSYGVAVDLWSSGCILAELLAGKPIMPGRTEVEQLHKIFKLCGSPSEEYWRKSRLPHATIFKPTQPYKRCLEDLFKDFPSTSLALLDTLLAIDPAERGTATSALKSDFFHTKPLPCDPSSLPEYPPSKEYDAKLREEEARRVRAAGGRGSRGGAGAAALDGQRKTSNMSHAAGNQGQRNSRAVPAPHANAEDPAVIALEKARQTSGASSRSKSDKFSVMAADGAGGYHSSHIQAHSGIHSQLMQGPGGQAGDNQSGVDGGQGAPAHPHSLTGRMAGAYPHISKSGPQPMLAGKGAGQGSSGKPGVGNSDLQGDVRMAPPRLSTRAGKSITVPDFSLTGGYPDPSSGSSTNNRGAHAQSARETVSANTNPTSSSPLGSFVGLTAGSGGRKATTHIDSSQSNTASFATVEQSVELEASTGESNLTWRQTQGGFSGPVQLGGANLYTPEKSRPLDRKKWGFQSPNLTSGKNGLEERRPGSGPGPGGALPYSDRNSPGSVGLFNGQLPSAAALAAKEGKRRYMPRAGVGDGFEMETGYAERGFKNRDGI